MSELAGFGSNEFGEMQTLVGACGPRKKDQTVALSVV